MQRKYRRNFVESFYDLSGDCLFSNFSYYEGLMVKPVNCIRQGGRLYKIIIRDIEMSAKIVKFPKKTAA